MCMVPAVPHVSSRVLVVDDADGPLSVGLAPSLARYAVDFARDPVSVLHHIDWATVPHALIFCDMTRGDIPGPELWAYLSIRRRDAADRLAFVASTRLRPPALAFLSLVPNVRLALPLACRGNVAAWGTGLARCESVATGEEDS